MVTCAPGNRRCTACASKCAVEWRSIVERFRRLVGDDGQFGVALDAEAGVDQLTIDLAGQRGLGQAGADRSGDIANSDGMVEFAAAAVGKGNRDHGFLLPLSASGAQRVCKAERVGVRAKTKKAPRRLSYDRMRRRSSAVGVGSAHVTRSTTVSRGHLDLVSRPWKVAANRSKVNQGGLCNRLGIRTNPGPARAGRCAVCDPGRERHARRRAPAPDGDPRPEANALPGSARVSRWRHRGDQSRVQAAQARSPVSRPAVVHRACAARLPGRAGPETQQPQQTQLHHRLHPGNRGGRGRGPDAGSAWLRRHLRALCAWLGIEFTPKMLAWPAGSRDTDGIWAPHWYARVWASTGFEPPPAQPPRLNAGYAAAANACLPHYERLYGVRLVV